MITVSPSLLNNPTATNFSVIARQPAACGDLGAIVLKGLSLNTAFKVSYNFNGSLVDVTLTSVGDSIRIPLIKGTYADFKVSINTCSKTVLGNYILKDPISVALVERNGNSNYCQFQVIAKSDLIDRVKAADNGVLKWYTIFNGLPTLEPEAPSTDVVGTKKIWVRQTINNCDSDTLGLKVVIAASSILKANKFSPSSCGLADGKIEITGLISNNDYQIEYKKAGLSAPIATIKSDATGKIAIGNLGEGIYTSITATPIAGNTCLTNSKDTLQLIPPLAPTVPPSIAGGNEYCAGSIITPLSATANSGGKIDWFIDPALTNQFFLHYLP